RTLVRPAGGSAATTSTSPKAPSRVNFGTPTVVLAGGPVHVLLTPKRAAPRLRQPQRHRSRWNGARSRGHPCSCVAWFPWLPPPRMGALPVAGNRSIVLGCPAEALAGRLSLAGSATPNRFVWIAINLPIGLPRLRT